MRMLFEGYYFKQQKENTTLACIAGRSSEEAFVQVITNERSFQVFYPLDQYKRRDRIAVGPNTFGADGISLRVETDAIRLFGDIVFDSLTELPSDIMGPFRFLPMECRHRVVSMRHGLFGCLTLNGRALDFTGGFGYIEGDSGRSFPESYAWFQCNDFQEPCSVMASIAKIPFCGFSFTGCICAIWRAGKHIRLATYSGATVLEKSENRLEIKQGKLRLTIDVEKRAAHPLSAPGMGWMNRVIHEAPVCGARVRLLSDADVLLDAASRHASFEYV